MAIVSSARLVWPVTVGVGRASLSLSDGASVRLAHLPEPALRRVPTDETESAALLRRPQRQPEQRRLHVVVLGIPNSGKSTLVNSLLRWPVCSVSSKVHTTRTSSRAVLTAGHTQLVLEDTPGLVTDAERRRHGLDEELLREPAAALRRADLVCVLHDVSDTRNSAGLSAKVQRLLFAEPHRPAVLVLTKVDTLLRKRRLLELTHHLTEGCVDGDQLEPQQRQQWTRSGPAAAAPDRQQQLRALGVQLADGYVDRDAVPSPPDAEHRHLVLTGEAHQLTDQQLATLSHRWRTWPLFRRVFMTAALHADGVSPLCEFLVAAARPAPWRFSAELVTDRRPRQLAVDMVRARLLEHLPAEVPYRVRCEVTQWERDLADVLAVEMRLECDNLQHSRILLRRIRAVARDAEQGLRDTFRCELVLRLDVHPRPPNWGRSAPRLDLGSKGSEDDWAREYA